MCQSRPIPEESQSQDTSWPGFRPASKWPGPISSYHMACFWVYLYSSASWLTAQAPVREEVPLKTEFPSFCFFSLTNKKYPKLGMQKDDCTSFPWHTLVPFNRSAQGLSNSLRGFGFVWLTIYYWQSSTLHVVKC